LILSILLTCILIIALAAAMTAVGYFAAKYLE
jgi:hypothetical protein